VSTPSGDAALSQRLAGKWSGIHDNRDYSARIEDTTELHPDGTFERRGAIHDSTGIRRYTDHGTWRVANGYFRQTIRSSTYPGLVPKVEIAQHIEAVTDWEWVMQIDTGRQIKYWRYPE